MPVGQLKLGMHVLRADGRYGVITGYKVVPGAKVMYNLEVAQDHTFTVGIGQWVVHNSDTCGDGSGPGFPTDTSQTQHIFRNAPGHFTNDTPANRQLIMATASDSNNLVGTDRFGNDWYTSTLSDGSQVWVSVRGNMIQNAGINDVPWSWNSLNQRLVP